MSTEREGKTVYTSDHMPEFFTTLAQKDQALMSQTTFQRRSLADKPDMLFLITLTLPRIEPGYNMESWESARGRD